MNGDFCDTFRPESHTKCISLSELMDEFLSTFISSNYKFSFGVSICVSIKYSPGNWGKRR